MVSFISAAKEAVLAGRCLLVQVYGNKHQYHKVTVVDRPKGPTNPSNEAEAKVA